MPIVSKKPAGGAPVEAVKPQSKIAVTKPVAKPWYVRGDATADAVAKEDHRIEEEQAQRGKLFRFWLEKGEEGAITFVDGFLTEKGVLDTFMFREHSLFMNGRWGNNFVCVSEQEPCPICEGGDTPSLVGCFTIIDHRDYVSKKGNKYSNTRKLFVAKRNSLKLLQKEATKHGGLAGCQFDVSRIGDQAPRVGDVFSFSEKGDLKQLAQHYTQEFIDPATKKKVVRSNFVPADYGGEIHYLTASELRKLGFGKGSPIGGEGPVSGAKQASSDVEEELG
jgi:hypothetical protein